MTQKIDLRGINLNTPLVTIFKILGKIVDRHEYTVGDSIELVAYRQGQKDIVNALERRIKENSIHTLPGDLNGKA